MEKSSERAASKANKNLQKPHKKRDVLKTGKVFAGRREALALNPVEAHETAVERKLKRASRKNDR